jgi:hypothetical protein
MFVPIFYIVVFLTLYVFSHSFLNYVQNRKRCGLMLEKTVSAEGGIRTHEPLRDRLLKPTPLTWLGDLCVEQDLVVIENNSY